MANHTKYKPEYCQALIEHMEEGFSLESFAGELRISKRTLYVWFEKHEDFAEAKEIGTEVSRLWWEKIGNKNVLNKSEFQGDSVSINSPVWIFNMKNRFGWRDKQPDEHDVVVNNNANLSEHDLDAKIDELLKEIKK